MSACGQKASGRCAGNERFRPWLGFDSALDSAEVTAAASSNLKLCEAQVEYFLVAKAYHYHANELSHSGFLYTGYEVRLARTRY